MTRVDIPELKRYNNINLNSIPILTPFIRFRYVDKRIRIQLNANRKVSGVLRGYDAFMNLVLDEAIEESAATKPDIGMVVIRGNSIQMVEALERLA